MATRKTAAKAPASKTAAPTKAAKATKAGKTTANTGRSGGVESLVKPTTSGGGGKGGIDIVRQRKVDPKP
jgi:hypothetical protein